MPAVRFRATPLPTDLSLVAVPTLERYTNCHLLSGLEGTVAADPRWVLAYRPDAGQPWAGQVIKVYWPAGWTARRDGDRLALLDAMRTVVAHDGDTVGLGGGEQYDDGYWACFVQVESPLGVDGAPAARGGRRA